MWLPQSYQGKKKKKKKKTKQNKNNKYNNYNDEKIPKLHYKNDKWHAPLMGVSINIPFCFEILLQSRAHDTLGRSTL